MLKNTIHAGFLSLTCLLILLAPMTAAAQELFTEGSRSAAMGESYTGVAEGTNALYHNPAGIARSVMYAVDATFEYAANGSILNAAVIDSKTNPSVSAGAAYSYFFGRDETEGLKGHDIRLGIALPVVPDRISLGIGGRYLILDQDDVELVNGFTLDAGTLIKVTDGLHVGIAGKNLIDQCDKVTCDAVAPSIVSAGLSFGTNFGLVLAGDVGFNLTTADEVKPEFSIGAEYLAVMVPLRAGFQRIEATDQSSVTFGLGFRSAAAGFDLSGQYELNQEEFNVLGSFSIYL